MKSGDLKPSHAMCLYVSVLWTELSVISHKIYSITYDYNVYWLFYTLIITKTNTILVRYLSEVY